MSEPSRLTRDTALSVHLSPRLSAGYAPPTPMLNIESRVELSGGIAIPQLGLGVYQSAPGQQTQDAVLHALRVGYRHIDTARAYRNERDVGSALLASGLPRQDVFLTTKLSNRQHGFEPALRACDESLQQLGVEAIDLYLIHWPLERLRHESWRALEALHEEGKCRAIGVSNYTVRHLEELLSRAKVVPAVNQVELNPFLSQRELVAFCRRHGIQVVAYAPLAQGQRLAHPQLLAIARKHQRSGAQVLLRWGLQQGLVVIPKSVRPARIEENARLYDFALDEGDLAILDGLEEGLRTCWDPTDVV